MSSTSLAQDAHPVPAPTEELEHVSAIAGRVLRGQELYREHADAITCEDGVWYVPSQHDATGVYEVRLGRKGDDCECIDFGYHGHEHGCKHIVAATIARAKTAACVGCGMRFRHRELVEVHEDHESLTWFPGDKLCRRECAGAHGVR